MKGDPWFQYITNSRTGCVHLVEGGVRLHQDPRTLCGRFIEDPQLGIGTIEAPGVTCKTCLRAHQALTTKALTTKASAS